MRNILKSLSLVLVVGALALTTGCGKMIAKTEVVFDRDTTWIDNRTPEPVAVEPPKPVEITFGDIVAPVYFDYDSYDLNPASIDVLKRIAEFLEKNAETAITVEGHCDERGTQGYNQALGQRRADAVKSYFVNFGIASKRITTISYGELRPAVSGSDESSYEKNRRSELLEK